MNNVTMKLQADPLILQALQEDITSEDVTTNAILSEDGRGQAELLAKDDGVIAGLAVFARAFTLLDEASRSALPSRTAIPFIKGRNWPS